jgi:multiple sugar transport system substrate-binding protein
MHVTKRAAAVASLALAATIGLAGCSSGADSAATAGATCAPSSGKVTLNFTSWVPGIDKVVQLWNDKNPDIQVKVQIGPNGNSGTYKNFFNELKAGNAPDLGQVEYDALPNFRVQDALTDLSACSEVSAAKSQFVARTW